MRKLLELRPANPANAFPLSFIQSSSSSLVMLNYSLMDIMLFTVNFNKLLLVNKSKVKKVPDHMLVLLELWKAFI